MLQAVGRACHKMLKMSSSVLFRSCRQLNVAAGQGQRVKFTFNCNCRYNYLLFVLLYCVFSRMSFIVFLSFFWHSKASALVLLSFFSLRFSLWSAVLLGFAVNAANPQLTVEMAQRDATVRV